MSAPRLDGLHGRNVRRSRGAALSRRAVGAAPDGVALEPVIASMEPPSPKETMGSFHLLSFRAARRVATFDRRLLAGWRQRLSNPVACRSATPGPSGPRTVEPLRPMVGGIERPVRERPASCHVGASLAGVAAGSAGFGGGRRAHSCRFEVRVRP